MSHTVTASSISSKGSNKSNETSSIASFEESDTNTPINRSLASHTLSEPTKRDLFTYEIKVKGEDDDHGIAFKDTKLGVTIGSVIKNSPGGHVPIHRLVSGVNGVAPGSADEAHKMVEEIRSSGFSNFTLTVTNVVCEDYKETIDLNLSSEHEPLGYTVENTSSQPEGGLLITAIDRYSVMAVAGVPVGSVLCSIDEKSLSNIQDFTSIIASLRSRELKQYKIELLIKQGTERSQARKRNYYNENETMQSIQPARSVEETTLRERLRRDIMLKEQRLSRRERRVDYCNGFALTHLEFITNYGNDIGSQRWHLSADTTTPILNSTEITPTSSLNVSLIGNRIQMRETAQVLVVVSQGPSFKWYKIPFQEMTGKELSYLELLDNKPSSEPTVVTTLNQLTPTTRLSENDLNRRAQLRSNGKVVRVAPFRGTTFAWQYVPEIEWTASEIRFASTLPSISKSVNNTTVEETLSNLWVDGSPIFSPVIYRRGMR